MSVVRILQDHHNVRVMSVDLSPLNSGSRTQGSSATVGGASSPLSREKIQDKLTRLRENLASVIRGKKESIDLLTISLLAGGSVLMEDVPGVGKTTLAKALARSLDVEFRRIQFTPDLLPTDILGSSIYNQVDGEFHFRKGPIFCSVLLADEINRASPRTQSALLEAMSEGQATIEGERHRLPAPFIVLATQNPIDFQGTYPLPEAQLDRFLVHLHLGYPSREAEVELLYAQALEPPLDHVEPVLNTAEILHMQSLVREVKVEQSVAEYLVEIVRRTRNHPQLKLGVSPRGTLMFFRASQASAFSAGRDYVLPDDAKNLATSVLAHRTVLTSQARYGSLNKDQLIAELVAQVRVPV